MHYAEVSDMHVYALGSSTWEFPFQPARAKQTRGEQAIAAAGA
jgi:hypothetical protein